MTFILISYMGSEIIISELKKTVVFLGYYVDEKISFGGTGFRLSINNLNFIVTAKHVVTDESGNVQDKNMLLFFNSKDGHMGSREINETKEEGADWFFHPNPDVDVALIPVFWGPEEDVKFIRSEEMENIDKIMETQDVVFLSYQPGTPEFFKINPVIRQGIVSQIKEDKTFLIDGSAYPGNSGSPLFKKSTSLTKTFDELSPKDFPKLIGIVGAYIPYLDEAISTQTKRTRIIFEENTGLSLCWPVNYIQDIIKSKEFKKYETFAKKRKPTKVTKETTDYTQVR